MSSRRAIALSLVVASFAVYAQTVEFEFLEFDDHKYLTLHDRVRVGLTVENLRWAATAGYFSNWHPVTWYSYMLDSELFGIEPAAFHAMNVLFHVIATLLLFGGLSALTGSVRRSGVVAALFALHPLHVESVAWVSERKDVLSAVFGFGAIWLYSIYARLGGGARWLGVTLCLVLAMASKPTAVTLPFVLGLLDFWPLRRFSAAARMIPEGPQTRAPERTLRFLVAEKLPWLAASGGVCAATLWSQSLEKAMVPDEAVSLPLRAANAVVSYAMYLVKTIWPDDLTIIYPHPNLAGGTPLTPLEVTVAALLLVVLSLLAWRYRARGYPAVGWLWYLGMLVPAIGLIQVGAQARADRYTYLPLVGIFIATVWGSADIAARRLSERVRVPIITGVVCGVLLFCAGATYLQARVWRTDTTLLVHGLEINPRNALFHRALAREHKKEGHLDAALHHYHVARALAPAHASTRFDLADMLAERGEYESAETEYRAALEIDPKHVNARKHLGQLLLAMDDIDAAIVELTRAAQRSPRDTQLHMQLALALVEAGRPKEAIVHWEDASRLAPGWAKPLDEIAWLLATSRDAGVRDGVRAVELAQRAAGLAQGRRPQVLATLAAAYAETGRFDLAISQAEVALATSLEAEANGWARDARAALLLYAAQQPLRAQRRSPRQVAER